MALQCADCQAAAEVFCVTCEVGAAGLPFCSACSASLHAKAARAEHELHTLCQECSQAAGVIHCTSCCKLRTLYFCEACSDRLHRSGGPRHGHALGSARFVDEMDALLGIGVDTEPAPTRRKKKPKVQKTEPATMTPECGDARETLQLLSKLDWDSIPETLKLCRCYQNPAGVSVTVTISTARTQDWVKDLADVVAGVWTNLEVSRNNHVQNCDFTFTDNVAAACLFTETYNQWIDDMARMPAADRKVLGEENVIRLRQLVGQFQQTDV